MSDSLSALTLVAALGCGLNAGVFFAFSSFVMKALARLRPAQGIAAMQSINVLAVTPVFMTALFGTGLLCLALAAWSLADWQDSFSAYLLAGSVLYVLGAIGVTMAFNVPRNEALARLEPDGADAAAYWPRYVAVWTAANHARTVAGLAGAASLAAALTVG